MKAESPLMAMLPANKRRPRLPQILPRKVITVTLPPEEQLCDGCNQPMHVMGEEIRKELELIPAHVQVTHYVREKYRCRYCEQRGTTDIALSSGVNQYENWRKPTRGVKNYSKK